MGSPRTAYLSSTRGARTSAAPPPPPGVPSPVGATTSATAADSGRLFDPTEYMNGSTPSGVLPAGAQAAALQEPSPMGTLPGQVPRSPSFIPPNGMTTAQMQADALRTRSRGMVQAGTNYGDTQFKNGLGF